MGKCLQFIGAVIGWSRTIVGTSHIFFHSRAEQWVGTKRKEDVERKMAVPLKVNGGRLSRLWND